MKEFRTKQGFEEEGNVVEKFVLAKENGFNDWSRKIVIFISKWK